MVNEMRDKLVPIVKNSLMTHIGKSCNLAENIVDDIIANGVIVPLCKCGTRVVVIQSKTSDGKNLYIFEDTVTHYNIVDGFCIMGLDAHLGIPNYNWDKVFFGENARERAEQKLKEMNGEK